MYHICVDSECSSFLIFERIHLSESLWNDSRFGVLGYESRYRVHIRVSVVGFANIHFSVDRSMSDVVVNGANLLAFGFPIRLKYSSIS